MEIPPQYRSKDLHDRYFESEHRALSWIGARASNHIWQYPQFRDYLETQLEDDSAPLPTRTFPKRICLSQEWKDYIIKIGRGTATENLEMSGLVAGDVRTRRIDLRKPQSALAKQVSSTILSEAMNHAAQEGYTHVLGRLHSHPFASCLKKELLDQILKNYGPVWFSAIDLLSVARRDNSLTFTGVVGAKDVLFAFRTEETDQFGVVDLAHHGAADEWSMHWNEGKGIRYSQELIEYVEQYPDAHQRINYGIAAKHRLVLYRSRACKGPVIEDPVREFPE